MPVTRFVAAAWSALLPLAAVGQSPRTPPVPCPPRPAECRPSTPVFNFGRHVMTANAPPVLAEGTVSVTCTKGNGRGYTVDITYDLMGEPSQPGRSMRDHELAHLAYDFYVDAGRRQYWGDGKGGTRTFSDKMELNDVNRVVTHVHQVYGMVHGQQVAEPGQWLGFVVARLEYTIKKCK